MEVETGSAACAPLPHFEVLKEEMQENQSRVHEFMRGSYTYKPQHKPITEKVNSVYISGTWSRGPFNYLDPKQDSQSHVSVLEFVYFSPHQCI